MILNPVCDFRIGAGNGLALAALTNIEMLEKIPPPTHTYSPGVYRTRGDGTLYIAGYASVLWTFAALTRPQVTFLQTTYCASGYSGKVTIYTRTGGTAYTRYSAVMILPSPADADRQFTVWRNYAIRFTHMVAL